MKNALAWPFSVYIYDTAQLSYRLFPQIFPSSYNYAIIITTINSG